MIQAAGILFQAPSGRVLLLRRSAEGDAEGLWALPGGKIEDGETAARAAVRECVEEIGFNPGTAGDELAHRVKDDVDYMTFLRKIDEEFTPKLNEEHTAFKWVLPEEAMEA